MSLTTTMESVISMSIYAVLTGEHREVRTLFTSLQVSPDMIDGGKEMLFGKLRRELLSHAYAEHATVYSRIAERMSKEEVQEPEREHKEIEQILDFMRALNVTSDEWKARLQTLMEKVDDHIKKEEGPLFEKMKRMFSEEEALEMAKKFTQIKEEELHRLEDEDKNEE